MTVIDPSNFLFSLHLSNDVVTTRITHGALEKIVVIPWSKGQIYKSNKETGPAPDQFRECVDIAVKLAFGFNAQEEPPEILTKKDVIQNPVIQCISNNSGIDRHWEYQVAGRMKQASELGVVDMFHNCSQKMTTLLAALEEIESEGIELPDDIIDLCEKAAPSDGDTASEVGFDDLLFPDNDNMDTGGTDMSVIDDPVVAIGSDSELSVDS